MSKNIVIFFLSLFGKEESKIYTDETGKFKEKCLHTNETGLKYLEWKLKEKNEEINSVYAIVTPQAEKDALEKFQNIFANKSYSINSVPLRANNDLSGSFKTVCDLYDVLQKEMSSEDSVIIHADMTGGFRHSSMLMLALLQMVQYSGAEVGNVIYTNFSNQIVEDAKELVSLFTLLGGAEEFAAFGNVFQIQKYFYNVKEKSVYLRNLLDKMENFSEMLKICSNLNDLFDTMQVLDKALKSYKEFLNKQSGNSLISEQEEFFCKLLPTIEKEYADVLKYSGKHTVDNIPKIIKWCAQKGFLQQAVTLYTEWMPIFVIDKELIIVNQKNIIENCRKNCKKWSNWRIYFFKEYMPSNKQTEYNDETDTPLFNYETLIKLISSRNSVNKIIMSSKVYNSQDLNKFIECMQQIQKFVDLTAYVDDKYLLDFYRNLPNTNAAKFILKKATPTNTTEENFILKRLKKLKNLEDVILSCIKQVDKKEINSLFGFSSPKTVKENKRSDIFDYMLERKMIDSRMSNEDLKDFIDGYINCVQNWRNKFNHASGNVYGKSGNYSISRSIIKNIETIEKYF